MDICRSSGELSMPHADARSAAHELTEAGFVVLPLPSGSKVAHEKGWPDRAALSKEECGAIRHDANLGIVLGPDFVDVDMDAPETQEIGARRFPDHSAIIIAGKSSTPKAHKIYSSKLPNAFKFSDPFFDKEDKKACLLELRTGRQQSVVFGTHPSGQPVRFNLSAAAGAEDGNELLRIARQVVTAAMLLRHLDEADLAEGMRVFAWLRKLIHPTDAVVVMSDVDIEMGLDTRDWTSVNVPEDVKPIVVEKKLEKAVRSFWAIRKSKAAKEKIVVTLNAVRLSEVERSQVEWLWDGRIAWGKLSAIVGDPGVSKSTLTVDIAARLTCGMPLFDSAPSSGRVFFLCAEDDDADTILPRLDAAGGDPAKCLSFSTVKENGKDVVFNLERHLEALEAAIAAEEDRVLVIIDPLNAFIGHRKAHVDQDIRQVLSPLAKMASRTGAAIVIVTHMNRGEAPTAIQKVSGGTGLIGAVRSGILVASHPDASKPDSRILACLKQNLSKPFRSVEYEVRDIDGYPAIGWIGESDYTANDLIAAPLSHEQRSALADAQEFLQSILSEGPRLQVEIQKIGEEQGHSASTLRRAKTVMNVASKKCGSAWYWRLAGDERIVEVTNDAIANLAPSGQYAEASPVM